MNRNKLYKALIKFEFSIRDDNTQKMWFLISQSIIYKDINKNENEITNIYSDNHYNEQKS